MQAGEKITVQGEVVSVKPKWDRFDEQAQGVMVVPANSDTAFWFRWSPERGVISRGDKVKIDGTVTGEGKPNRKGQTTVFLKGVRIAGKKCGHKVLILNSKSYVCDGCGLTATVSIGKKGA